MDKMDFKFTPAINQNLMFKMQFGVMGSLHQKINSDVNVSWKVSDYIFLKVRDDT